MENMTVYVNALQDSLHKKLEVVKSLLQHTQKQNEILRQEEPDMDAFESAMESKGALLQEMEKLDQGFDALYAKISSRLQEEKSSYQSQILQMQNVIRSITDCGLRIEGVERQNKDLLQKYLARERKEIREFKVNNKTAVSYYQNMANQHREWQSYFMDQKK